MKGNNIIDSRDVILRFEELEDELSSLESALEDAENEEDQEAIEVLQADIDSWKNDNEDELHELEKLVKDGQDYSADWIYGATLIHDDYFTRYAEELASDVCDMKSASEWPFCCIDWDAASEQLKQDYTEIDFGGESYWVR